MDVPIIGPSGSGKLQVEVKAPSRLEEWPDSPSLPRPRNEHEEAKLIDRLNASLKRALEGELGVAGFYNNMPVVLTNRAPSEVLENLQRAEAQALEHMMDPVNMGLGSIRSAVLRSFMRHNLLEEEDRSELPPEVEWDKLRDLLHEILPTAAIRLQRGSGEDQILAAHLICYCRIPMPLPEGPLRLFSEGMHPIVDAMYERAKEVLKKAGRTPPAL